MNQTPSGLAQGGTPIGAEAYSSMFQCLGGLRNFRAAGAMMSCFVAGILLAGVIGFAFGYPSPGKSFFSALVLMLFFFTGIHAAGVLLMDQARGVPMRGMVDAIVYGVLCIPKTLALILGLVLIAIVVYIALAILFFVCKMPGIGPVLFTLVFPLAILIGGLTATAMMLAFQMSLAAIWEGASISRALAQSIAILRSRLVETVLLMVVVGLLSGLVFAFVAAVLLFGLFPALGMSMSIIGAQGMGGGMASMMSGMTAGGGAYAIAGGIGGGVLWALALTLVFQVSLLGLNLIYLRVSEGLDTAATEAAMRAHLDDAKRKAAEMGQKAKEAAERAKAHAEQAAAQRRAAQVPPAAPLAAPMAAAAPAMSNACPECKGAVTSADVFCGNCGFKLK